MQPETLCGVVAAAQLSEIRDNATSEEGETLNIVFCFVLSMSFFVKMTSALQDPFVGISKEYKHALQEEHKRLLTSFFTKSSADAFLLEMHEFLLLVLKNPKATDTFRPDWG